MPLFDLFFTLLMFFLFCLWLYLVIMILTDVFGSADLSGWGKAGWTLFVVLLPFLGSVVYLTVRGDSMNVRFWDRAIAASEARQELPPTAGSRSVADEIARLAELRDAGSLTDEEFAASKAKLLS